VTASQVQQRVKLCVKRDLTEHDIVSRIMRKENYLIGAQQLDTCSDCVLEAERARVCY